LFLKVFELSHMLTDEPFSITQGFLYLDITTFDFIALGNNRLNTTAQAFQFFSLGGAFRVAELREQRG